MNQFSEMNEYELNKKIALKRGWKERHCKECGHEWWQEPDGGVDYNQTEPPCFSGDIKYAMQLFDEMNGYFLFNYGRGYACSVVAPYVGAALHRYKWYSTPARAIAEAYVQKIENE